jgi:CrcB protein
VKQRVLRQYILVGIAGGVGTLCRFGVGEWLHPPWPPLPTLIINFTGSLLIGTLQGLSEPDSRFYLGPNARLVLMTGFCGGYTTFSAFSALSFRSLQNGDWNEALLNILATHLLGFGAVIAGYFVCVVIGRLMETWTRWLQRRRNE